MPLARPGARDEFARRCGCVAAVLGLVVTISSVGTGRDARAACNIIPPALPTFRSTQGNTDRPFARPGDWVRLIHDATCHGAAAGFPGTTQEQVVTIVFEPPGGGPRNVVALATSCPGSTRRAAPPAPTSTPRRACP